jgi:hypothetical protein
MQNDVADMLDGCWRDMIWCGRYVSGMFFGCLRPPLYVDLSSLFIVGEPPYRV